MPQAAIFAKDFSPWTPAVDPRRMASSGIIEGRNFLVDVDGPRSAFGTRFSDRYNFWPIPNRYKLTELKIADELMYGDFQGVWKYGPLSGLPEPLITVKTTQPDWPWTKALVGGLWYFAQNGIGLYQYRLETNTVRKINTPVGDDIVGICESQGRLCAISSTTGFWSAIDDGTDFFPSLVTGAGAQVLSLLGGTAYRIDPVEDGFIVAMSRGLLKFEAVDADYVFHPSTLSTTVKIWTPNAAVKLPDIGMIYLDDNGFHVTNGTVPVAWEVEMGVFIKDNILKRLVKTGLNAVGIYFSQASLLLAVYFADNLDSNRFIRTFVFYTPAGKWGSFDEHHHGWMEVLQQDNPNVFQCSYMATDGYMRTFLNVPWQEIVNFDTTTKFNISDRIFRPLEDARMLKNTQAADERIRVRLGFCEFDYMDTDPSVFLPYNTVKVYSLAPDHSLRKINFKFPHRGLNSFIDIGMFRFSQQVASDEMSSINQLIVGMSDTIFDFDKVDLNTETGTEDLNSGSDAEDFGSYYRLGNSCTVQLLSSLDGFNVSSFGWEVLIPVNSNGASTLFMPQGRSGIFHRIRLEALNVDESFALKVLDITGQLTGRLF